jgi:hypothetical protein
MEAAMGSTWSAQRQQGFALAAAAHDDRAGERALPGLARDVAAGACALARGVAQLDRAARRRWVRDLLVARAPLDLSSVATHPARARALLASEVPREIGRAWLAAAPAPRAGYVPGPRLLALLRALRTSRDDEAHGGERSGNDSGPGGDA